MFAPSGGKHHNVNNKLRMDLIYLLPHPPPPRRHRVGAVSIGVAGVQPPPGQHRHLVLVVAVAAARRASPPPPATPGRDGAGGSAEEKEGQ